MRSRIIYHVDVNSAFLSWEAVHRLMEGDPVDLRQIPSAVGGDVKSRHGIITAKSIPAKAYGIETAEPVASALRKCPDLVVVPSTPGLYSRCSKAFMDICRETCPVIEPFSVDECFMDMSLVVPDRDPEKAYEMAVALKDRIKNELFFTVNIGIGDNKLLAKMASDFKKPDRVHTLWHEEIEKKMWPLPVGDLLFIGKNTVPRLQNLGIRTIGELANTPVEILRAHFGEKAAASMHRDAMGISDSPVTDIREDAKSYGHTTTLQEDITTREEALPTLLWLSDKVTARMRRDGKKAGLVTVTIRSNEFSNHTQQRKLQFHTDAADVVYQEAVRLFDTLWDGHTPLRLLGVSCGNISDGNYEQLSLFGTEEREKREKLGKMLDDIRNRFGEDAVLRTTELKWRKENEFKGKFEDG